MRSPAPGATLPCTPALMHTAGVLAQYMKGLSSDQLQTIMHISAALADKTYETYAAWNDKAGQQSLAIDSFVGDIYSGLRATTLSAADRQYANDHLRILSGLYGILRPFDGVRPYRLEMGYRLPGKPYANLYDFWGATIAETLPSSGLVINLAAVEYSRTITPYVEAARVVSPRFLTVDPKTGEPTFVVVHAKIARGAYARWLITSRANDRASLPMFSDIGYRYAPQLSTPAEPVFVCQEFGGKGLSMRLEK